jgi:hypothetical protein
MTMPTDTKTPGSDIKAAAIAIFVASINGIAGKTMDHGHLAQQAVETALKFEVEWIKATTPKGA